MTREETVKIIRIMCAAYSNYKPVNLNDTIEAWHMFLDDVPYNTVTVALKNFIRTSGSEFAPSIGQLMESVRSITTPTAQTAQQAWAQVMQAVRNSGYNSQAEFDKLPEAARQALGSPERLRSMALDSNFNEGVESSNFARSYNVVLKRQMELEKMSPDVRRIIEKVNEKALECANDQSVVATPEIMAIASDTECVSHGMPEEVKKAFDEFKANGAF